ncbi:hypothetical protein MGN70_003443 [Eutypa lata]|nr:hypothetical protein MGN70_003443 [Eutypa lata]
MFKKHIISDQASVPSTQTAQGQLLHKFALAIPPLPPINRLMVYTSIYPQEVISLGVAMTNFYVKERLFGPQATDPRDMVCGLLGFSTLYEKLYIMADYSIPVRESYIAVTQALISHGFTDVLAWAQAETKCIEGLASWVPDFSATILPSLCSHGQAKPWFSCFGASRRTYSTNEDSSLNNVLSLKSQCIDTVSRVGHIWFSQSRPDLSALPSGVRTTVQAKSATY